MKGILTRVEQRITQEYGTKKSVIYMWFRGIDKKRYCFIDPNFEPYCYLKKGILHLTTFSEVKRHSIEKINGREYVKVVTQLPSDIPKLRNIAEKKQPHSVVCFEGDVVFPLRYIINKKIRGAAEWAEGKRPIPIEEDLPINLRIFILDIELLLKQIKCVTIWDSYDEKYHTFYWNPKPISSIQEEGWKLYHFLNEMDMLVAICKFISNRDPDVITGFNIDFDLTNIRNRCIECSLGKPWDWTCPINKWGQEENLYHLPPPRNRKKKFRDFWITGKHQRIPGRNVIDLLEILLKMEKHQLSEFSLDYIARNYLKPPMEKLKYKGIPFGNNIHNIWPEDPEAVLRYNRHDVKLCVELNRQQQLIAFADEVRKFAGCQMDDIFSNKRIAHVELLRKAKKPLPVTKKEHRPYKGAIVIEPKKGVYRWIIVMDFRSLYPSIILQLNIDPDTYVPSKWRNTKNFNQTTCYILKDPDSGSEFWFKKQPRGDLPTILEDYLKARDLKKKKIKKLRLVPTPENLELAETYDIQQYALKVIANAFYGSLLYRGMPSAYQCARAVTSCARQAILFAKEVIEKMGYLVIYGDTDSILIQSKFNYEGDNIREAKRNYKKVVEEAEQISKKVAKEIPKFLSKLAVTHGKSYLELALDKVFERFLIDEKKKRYAGIPFTELGREKLEIKGFGAVRSDTSKFTANLQKTLIREILLGRQKADIRYIVENILDSYDKLPLTEIGVPCILTKDPKKYKANSVQKKAFSFSNRYLGTDYKVGDKPKRIYVKMDKEKALKINVVEDVDVLAFHLDNLKLPSWLSFDYPKMVTKTVKPKIEKVLQFVGLEWKDIRLKTSLRKKKKKRKKKTKRKKKLKSKGELIKGQTKLVQEIPKTHTKRK